MTNADEIVADLRHFADPYSEISSEATIDGHRVSWRSRRREMSAIFRGTDAGVRVEFHDIDMAYASFLAHEELGNLRFLAENSLLQFQSTKRLPSGIETSAIRGDGSRTPAHTIIENAIRNHVHEGTTHVVFLAAQGGSGKTKVLERVVLEGAQSFIRGEVPFLYFYVNAQGRALAQVDEAFAVELDILGAHLSFSAIAALTRAGAMVPVIDGFDELIGAVGYDEAFQSLGRFLDALRGSGQIVAAARSTYYEREFQARVRLRPQRDSWSLDTVTLLPWGPTERLAAVELVEAERRRDGVETTQKASRDARVQLGVRADALDDLLGRPFFSMQAARAILTGESVEEGADLLRSLTEALLRREVAEKFLDRNHVPMMDLSQAWAFLREVANELWYQQTRSLDGPSIDAVVTVVTERWQAIAVDRLRERVRDLPVFSAGEGGRLEFAHEYFFGLFLAEIIRDAVIVGGYGLENALGRGLLPEGVAEQVALCTTDAAFAFEKLNGATATEALRSALVRENAGTLGAAVLSAQGAEVVDIVARRMVFGNVSIACSIRKFDCVDCVLRRTDLTRASIGAGDWSTSQLELVMVCPGATSLKVSGLVIGANVRGISVLRDAGNADVWEPSEVTATLRELQVPLPETTVERSVDPTTVQVVQRLARAFLKSVFVATQDDVNAGFMLSPVWPRVLAVSLKHGLVTAEQRSTSGVAKIFYRCRTDPDMLMIGLSPNAKVDSKVRAFWDDLAAPI
ncbi:MAG: hypothetical protein ACHREM_03545 [Polyangiales bacterium]